MESALRQRLSQQEKTKQKPMSNFTQNQTKTEAAQPPEKVEEVNLHSVLICPPFFRC
jgi:hypothetical protein